jgi:3-deoxy-D-manno-octulosonic-acid transferase
MQLYNLLLVLCLPIVFCRLYLKSLKLPAYRARWAERLGIFKPQLSFQGGIWIHGASVGEIMAAIPIVDNIRQQLPDFPITITCVTPFGSDTVQNKFSNVFHVYCPLDANFAIKNFLNKTKPKLLIIIEKELWPNLINNCHTNNIPIVMANAQISNKSFSRYLLIKPLISHCLQQIAYFATQTKFDAYKIKRLINYRQPNNHPHNNIQTIGSSKFDFAVQNIISNANRQNTNLEQNNRPIWIAASTHPVEEDYILAAHRELLTKIPNALLILVPRHPNRAPQISQQVINLGFTVKIHSQDPTAIYQASSTIVEQIYLVDTIGELNALYQLSQAAFVGGSLIDHGCHNVIEPAALAIPIAVGPYVTNCQHVVFQLKLANGLITVKNSQQLLTILTKWLTNEQLRVTMGINAKNYLFNQCGASKKIAQIAIDLI